MTGPPPISELYRVEFSCRPRIAIETTDGIYDHVPQTVGFLLEAEPNTNGLYVRGRDIFFFLPSLNS